METFVSHASRRYTPDLLVCGLGPAGVSAAVSAARAGAKVLAVDKCAYAGGNITAANVIGVCGAVNILTGRLITGGITAELLRASGFLRDPVDYDKMYPLSDIDILNEVLQPPVAAADMLAHPNAVSMIYDAELYKLAADRLLAAAGVEVLFHTFVCEVKTEGERISEVIIANKDGLNIVAPKCVIDCTGDGDVAAWSGAPYDIKPDTMQAGTMMFVMGGVEYDDYAVLKKNCIEAFRRADADGVRCRYYGPGVGRLHHGVINFNMTRVPFNQTSAREWTDAEISARGDIDDCVHILKTYMPEFKNAYLLYSGPHIGARESRRIVGEYVLTGADIFARKSFSDTVALGGHPIDFHDPKVYGAGSGQLTDRGIVNVYEIPLRTLIPQRIDNLLVAGRCHSVDQQAAASTRVALTAAVLGEAAGTAAALAIESGRGVHETDADEVRARLQANGAILDINR